MANSSDCCNLPRRLILALVLLRLCVGWHFFREGTKKLAVDPLTGKTAVAESTLRATEGFLNAAVGPLAGFYRGQAPGFHDWQTLLAVPQEAKPLSAEDAAKLSDWRRSVETAKAKKDAPVQPADFPPVGPYTAWAQRIVDDWRRDVLTPFQGVTGVTEEQEAAGAARFDFRRKELADYLAGESEAIAEWRHELFRLANWEAEPEATEVPFKIARIAEKRAETSAKVNAWVEQVRGIERGLRQDLKAVLTDEQKSNAKLVAAIDAATLDPGQKRLARNSLIVTSVVTGVGVLLLLGLATRLASLAGVAFLLSVLASQPPWVSGAMTTVFYYQLVEVAALVVLFAAAAGRFAGLDYFLYAAMRKCCGRKET